MRHVVFKTPGLIDIRAFTVFGMSSKPNSDSPIGKFGTGLKMAIAVLVRSDIPISLWIGRTRYSFKGKKISFRDAEHQQIVMTKQVHGVRKILSKTQELLPFTTELGKYWSLWQAFRELESNTRDERGETLLLDAAPAKVEPVDQGQATHIIVSGEKFVQEYLDREKTFLPDGLTAREGTAILQVLLRPSQHVYWRGIRVWDLPKETPSEVTYNFLNDIELTEDRTAKDPYMLEYYIKNHIIASEDEELVAKVVQAKEGSYEAQLDYDYMGRVPTPTFSRFAGYSGASSAAARYAKSYVAAPEKEDPWKEYPRPWRTDDTGFEIYAADGKHVGQAQSAEIQEFIINKINTWKE